MNSSPSWTVLLFIATVALSPAVFCEAGVCTCTLSTERSALMDFFDAMNGLNWTQRGQWSRSGQNDLCNWFGVTCNGQNVVNVTLRANGLRGNNVSFPASFVNLTKLQHLDLSSNAIQGTLPEVIANITNLINLRLGTNQFMGPLPPSYGNLGNLQLVALEQNRLTGTLPDEWGRGMRALAVIQLSNNQLTGPFLTGWTTAFPNLTSIDIHSNAFSGPLPELWETKSATCLFPELTSLTLHTNAFEGDLPSASGSCLSRLQYLYLNGNNLNGTLPSSWFNLPSLLTLDLHDNRLSGTLPPSWGDFATLQVLALHNNRLNGSLPVEWSAMNAIQMFRVSENNLTGTLPPQYSGWSESIQVFICNNNRLSGTLPTTYRNWRSVRTIDLQANEFFGPLPSGWHTLNLGNLTSLNIRDNVLNGTLPDQWGTEVGNPPPMQELLLSNNRLTGSLPSSWSALTSLQKIELQGNSITGTLPSSWSALTLGSALTCLYLFSNKVTGPLPPEWGDDGLLFLGVRPPTSFSDLQLQFNQLNGTLPATWVQFSKLATLSVNGNELSGPLPPEWSNFESLQSLNLQDNYLSGSLPSEWSNLSVSVLRLNDNLFTAELPVAWGTVPPPSNGSAGRMLNSLSELYLFNNRLSGPLPAWTSLRKLRMLHLHSNRINGSLPDSWGELTALNQLHLNNNLLEGSLPGSAWSSLSSLEQLIVTSNRLSGTLPMEWFTLTSLDLLYALNNELSGSLPPTWGTGSSSLRLVTLGNNRLDGTLPLSWSLMPRLSLLTLSNNSLTGELPASWGSCRLSSLDARSNRLTGTLPSTWGTLAALKSLYLSSNLLEGHVPASWTNMTSLTRIYVDSNCLISLPTATLWPNQSVIIVSTPQKSSSLCSTATLTTTSQTVTPTSTVTVTPTASTTGTMSETSSATPTATTSTTSTATQTTMPTSITSHTTTAAVESQTTSSGLSATTTTTLAATNGTTFLPSTHLSKTAATPTSTSVSSGTFRSPTATTTDAASAMEPGGQNASTAANLSVTRPPGGEAANETTTTVVNAAELQGAAPPAAEVALRDGQASASSSAQVAAMMGSNPSAAMLASRSSSLLSALQRCSSGARGAVPTPVFPAALVPGGESLMSSPRVDSAPGSTDGKLSAAIEAHRAAVVLNVAVTLACAAAVPFVAFFIAFMRWARRRRRRTTSRRGEDVDAATTMLPATDAAAAVGFGNDVAAALLWLRFPGVLLIPALLGAEGVISSAVTLAQLSSSTADLVVVAFGLMWMIALEVFLFIVPFRALNVLGLCELPANVQPVGTHGADRAASSSSPLWVTCKELVAWGRRWVAPDEAGATYVRMLGQAFAKYHSCPPPISHYGGGAGTTSTDYHTTSLTPSSSSCLLRYRIAPYSSVVDFALLAVSATAKGVSDASSKECAGVLWAMLGCNLVGMVVVLAVRPFLSPLKNGLIGLSAAVTFLGSGLTLVAFLYPQHTALVPAAGALTTSATACATLAGIVSAVVALMQWVTGRSDARTVAEERRDAQCSVASDWLLSHDDVDDVALSPHQPVPNSPPAAPQAVGGRQGHHDVIEMTPTTHNRLEETTSVSAGAVVSHCYPCPTGRHAVVAVSTASTSGAQPAVSPWSTTRTLEDDDVVDSVVPRHAAVGALSDVDELLNLMTASPEQRVVKRSAEGQQKFDELFALLNAKSLE